MACDLVLVERGDRVWRRDEQIAQLSGNVETQRESG